MLVVISLTFAIIIIGTQRGGGRKERRSRPRQQKPKRKLQVLAPQQLTITCLENHHPIIVITIFEIERCAALSRILMSLLLHHTRAHAHAGRHKEEEDVVNTQRLRVLSSLHLDEMTKGDDCKERRRNSLIVSSIAPPGFILNPSISLSQRLNERTDGRQTRW